MSLASVCVSAVLALVGATVAAGQGQDYRAHEAHVHGAGAMNLALEGTDLYVELRSPAANLLGFEHIPGNAQEQAQLQRVRALLSQPTRLLALPKDAGCRLVRSDLELPWAGDAGQHAEYAPPGDAQTHVDIHAEYRFACDRPAALDGLEVLLFEMFPALQSLQVQYITPGRQAAAVLMPRQRSLRF